MGTSSRRTPRVRRIAGFRVSVAVALALTFPAAADTTGTLDQQQSNMSTTLPLAATALLRCMEGRSVGQVGRDAQGGGRSDEDSPQVPKVEAGLRPAGGATAGPPTMATSPGCWAHRGAWKVSRA